MKESRGIKGAWNSLESRKMSLHHNLGYFPFAWCWPFEHHNANSPRHSCKNADRALSATHMLPPSLTDFMMFTVPPHMCLFFPPLPLFSSLPSRSPLALCHLLSGISSRLTGLAVTLDFKELLHSSVTHQKERAIQRCAKREGGDEEWVYKKRKKKKEYALGGRGISVWKEGTREKADPLLTAGDLGSHKSKKRDMLPHIHTPMQSPCQHLNKLSHTCFPSCWVCADASCTFPSIVFCQSPFSLSVFFFCLLILLIWASGAEGASSPVPSVIPSLHLGIFFSQIFSTRPLATISKSVFSVFSLHWCSLTFSLFFSHSSVFWGGWQASFQVSGNCYCLPSQLESGSHSTAYKHTRTHRYAHLLFILLFFSLL